MSRRVRPDDYVGTMWQNFNTNPAVSQLRLIEQFYQRYITELALARFKWVNLPEEPEGDVRPRYLELQLFTKALAVFFKHKKWDKYLCLQATTPGQMDLYGDPTAFHVLGNGSTKGIDDGLTVSAREAVPIWANRLRVPELDMVSIYVRRMAQFDHTVDVNVKAMRHPFILSSNAHNKQSVLQIFKDIEEGQPAILVNDEFTAGVSVKDIIQILDMKIDPDLVTNLLIDKRKLWNEMLTFLGINNSNQDKRERLVQSEVTANDSEILIARAVNMDMRKEACEAINKKYGLDIDVEWNVNIDYMGDMPGLFLPHQMTEEASGGGGSDLVNDPEKALEPMRNQLARSGN